MHIENLLEVFWSHFRITNQYDRQMVTSLVGQVGCHQALTEKQAHMAINILRKNQETLSKIIGQDIEPMLAVPTYRQPLRKLSSIRTITVEPNPRCDKMIRVTMPYNEEIRNAIQEHKTYDDIVVWDQEGKSWCFSLKEKHILFLMNIAEKYNFEVDNEFKALAEQARSILDNMDQYVPMVSLENNTPVMSNSKGSIPKLESTEIIPALFEARKRGVFAWSDEVDNVLKNHADNLFTQHFLNSDPLIRHSINLNDHSINVLSDIVKNLTPVLFVIPGGSEQEKTTMIYNFLKSINFSDKEISIMFRSNSDIDGFNSWIKEHGLGTIASEKTKAALIKIQVPKPIIKSKVKFNSVISLGSENPHVTLKEFFTHQQNLIYYTEQKQVKDTLQWPPVK